MAIPHPSSQSFSGPALPRQLSEMMAHALCCQPCTYQSHVSPVSTGNAALRRRTFHFTSLKLKQLAAAMLDRADLLCHRVCLDFQTLSMA